MCNLILLSKGEEKTKQNALDFCARFCGQTEEPKYIFGRNIYAKKIIDSISVDGFIDDFTSDKFFLDAPIIKSEELPAGALVLIASGGMPLTAIEKIKKLDVKYLDYFAFYKWSGLELTDVFFNEGFTEDYKAHTGKYEWIYDLFEDELSKNIYKKLVNFRLSYNIEFLDGFSHREKEQYFEDFLMLKDKGEVFVDVGVYDAYTSLEFIKHCPGYQAVHLFEPDPDNYEVCKKNLESFDNINLHPVGLSNKKQVLKFSTQGSASKVCDEGDVEIPVDKLDDLLQDPVTFIKMDIEGSELDALDGAKQTILNDHPRLAISVYHNPGDFWRIPEKILSIRNDYSIYLRHYTESIYETVMFFIPKI